MELEKKLNLLTLKELEYERKKLWDQIDMIRNREQELKIGDYKQYIGRYFKSDEGALHSGYIRIDDIWASKDEVFIEGLHFNSEFINDYPDCHWMSYGAFEQLQYREEPIDWKKFKWIEIDRAEFDNAGKFDEIIFELSLVKGSNQELKYENPAGSITIKIK